MGYAPRLALGRRRVSRVSTNRLLGFLLCEDLLVLRFTDGHEVYQFVIYMK